MPKILPFHSGQFSIGDFNNDGIPDIQCFGSGHITIFSGTSPGQFSKPVGYTVDYYPGDGGIANIYGAAIGSIRNNGKLDVVVAVAAGFSFLFNVGSGFEETPRLSAPGSSAIVAVDVNGDGVVDLVTVGSSGLEVFFGTGNKAAPFTTGPVSPTPGITGAFMTTEDFNGDGIEDVAITVVIPVGHSLLAVCFGDGKGRFGPPTVINLPDIIQWITAGDVNGDRKLDLVTSEMSIL